MWGPLVSCSSGCGTAPFWPVVPAALAPRSSLTKSTGTSPARFASQFACARGIILSGKAKSRAFEAHAAKPKLGELGEHGDVRRDSAAELVAAEAQDLER